MSHSTDKIELKEGALIISDAHYSYLRPELLSLIKDIDTKKIVTPQLILMGDIFDALFGSIEYTYKQNREMIILLNKISEKIDVLFLEGNHDFNLKRVFKSAKVFSIKEQPLICSFEDEKVALAHGDFDAPFGYQLYTSIIRNPYVLKFLNRVDRKIDDKIIKKIDTYLTKKEDCNEFTGFRDYIQKRSLDSYSCRYFIEGHYHQNRAFSFDSYKYINLGAFACNQRYFIVKSLKDKELFIEENSYKES